MRFMRKKEKQNKNNDPLIRLMAPAIAGFTVCVFCLVSMTWAWFTASVETPAQTMQSAKQYTKVKVYEIVKSEDEEKTETKRLVKPTTVAKKTVEDEEILDSYEDVAIIENEEKTKLKPRKRRAKTFNIFKSFMEAKEEQDIEYGVGRKCIQSAGTKNQSNCQT